MPLLRNLSPLDWYDFLVLAHAVLLLPLPDPHHLFVTLTCRSFPNSKPLTAPERSRPHPPPLPPPYPAGQIFPSFLYYVYYPILHLVSF